MFVDEYWNAFVKDGKIESYLNYVEHLKKRGSAESGAISVDDRRADNKGTEYR